MSDWCLDCGGYFGISWLYDQSKEICCYTFLEILLSRLSLGQSPCPAPCLRRSWTTSSATAMRCLRRSSSQSVSYFPSTVQFLLPIQQFLLQELWPEVSSSRCSWHTTLRLAWRRWSLWPPGRERTSHMKEPSPCYGYFRHDVGCCAVRRCQTVGERKRKFNTHLPTEVVCFQFHSLEEPGLPHRQVGQLARGQSECQACLHEHFSC